MEVLSLPSLLRGETLIRAYYLIWSARPPFASDCRRGKGFALCNKHLRVFVFWRWWHLIEMEAASYLKKQTKKAEKSLVSQDRRCLWEGQRLTVCSWHGWGYLGLFFSPQRGRKAVENYQSTVTAETWIFVSKVLLSEKRKGGTHLAGFS